MCPFVSVVLLFDLFLSIGVRKMSRTGEVGVGSALPSSECVNLSSREEYCGVEGEGNLGEGTFGELVFGSGGFSISVACFGRGGKTNPAR